MRRYEIWALPSLLAVLVLSLALAGCGDTTSQAKVITATEDSEQDDDAIDPIERGKVRREALAFVEEALAAWLAGESESYEDYFGELPLEHFRTIEAQNQEEGLVRVRDHERVFLDAIDMNSDGTEVLVEYRFIENSYSRDASGDPVAEPLGEEKLIQIAVDETEDGWRLVRMIADTEVLQ